MSAKKLLSGVVLATAGSLAALPAAAASDYPSRPIRLIVPYAPGGPVDVIGRIAAQAMSEVLPQNVFVDNRPGGSGSVGTLAAIRSQPDGYTLLVGSTATISILPSLNPDIGYDPQRELTPISVVASGVHIYAVNPAVPVDDIRGFIRYVNARKDPLPAAVGGSGTPDDFALYLLEQGANIKLSHVPYKGTGPAIADVVAGHVPVVAADVSALLPFLQAGRLKPLGIAAAQRSPLAPTVPTLEEQGLKGVQSGGWFGVFAPAGTPPAVVDELSRKLAAKMATPEMQQRLRAAGLMPVSSNAATAQERVSKETEKWRNLIRTSNIKIE